MTKLNTRDKVLKAAAPYTTLPAATRAQREAVDGEFFFPPNPSGEWIEAAARMIRGIVAEAAPGCRERVCGWPVVEGRDGIIMMRRFIASIGVWVRLGQDLGLGPEWAVHTSIPHSHDKGWERQLFFELTLKAGITLEMLETILQAAARADQGVPRRATPEERLHAALKVESGADVSDVASELGATVAEVERWRKIMREAALQALEAE